MKNKKTNDLHDQAEKCRAAASLTCDEMNLLAEEEALDEFEKSEIAAYFKENADYIIGLILKGLNTLKAGNVPDPLRSFDAETLARLLSTSTQCDCEYHHVDDSLSDEETVSADVDDIIEGGYLSLTCTAATEQQNKIRRALAEYATAGAVYAKHIGSESLLAWAEILNTFRGERGQYAYLYKQDAAIRLVELFKSATHRLRLDKIVFDLPTFKPTKKGKKKATKKGKR